MSSSRINTTQKAYDYILNKFFNRDFVMGQSISEVEIAAEVGTSRSPVREALKMLEKDGLVVIIPNRGTFVKEFTLKDIRDIFELRVLLELTALDTSYQLINDEDLDRLEAGIRDLSVQHSFTGYHDKNSSLHNVIVYCSENSQIARIYDMLQLQLKVLACIAALETEEADDVRQDHIEIIIALRNRDLKKAHELLVAHLEKARLRTLRGAARLQMK